MVWIVALLMIILPAVVSTVYIWSNDPSRRERALDILLLLRPAPRADKAADRCCAPRQPDCHGDFSSASTDEYLSRPRDGAPGCEPQRLSE
jgi:hypothetical protein